MGTKPEHLLTEREVADYLGGQSLRTLRRWRQEGRGPAYVKVGRRVMYRPSDIQTWIEEHTVRRHQKDSP